MRRQIAILLALSALVLALGACAGERQELIETRQVALSGYAYDADLEYTADAVLTLAVEVYAVHRRGQDAPTTRLWAGGDLSVGSERYAVSLVGEGPQKTRPPCSAYHHLRPAAVQGRVERGLLLYLSEGLDHAYGLVNLEETDLGIITSRTENSVEISGPAYSAICFSEEGKTVWEINDFREVQPSVVALNFGSDISPLKRLRAHRGVPNP